VELAFRRHGYRATLVRANIAITSGRGEWDNALKLLRSINDSHEYYAKATLAQVLEKTTSDSSEAKEIFSAAYRSIRDLGHLSTVVEPRSRIWLLLVAGMCSRFTDGYFHMMEEHFSEAESLLASLPERDGQVCTVFSPRIKKNVDRSQIQADLDFLRRGMLLTEA
jgi:hypothetical protein